MNEVAESLKVSSSMNKVIVVLAACAIAAQIVYPLVDGETRDLVTVAVVAFLAAVALTHAVVARGASWAAVMFVATAGLGLASEVVGTETGFPYGSYFYATGRLGPDLFDVPAVVPLAWTAGFYPIWCAVGFVLRHRRSSPTRTSVSRIALTAIGMVGWDLYLDTQMVTDGQWTWTSPIAGLPGLPSIPMSNYLGWFAISLIMASIVEAATRLLLREPARSTAHVSDTVPLVIFMWTWLGSALAHAVFLSGPEMRYSAAYGLVTMGVVGIPLVRALVGRGRVAPAAA